MPLSALDFRFEPSEVRPAGVDQAGLALTNGGGVTHNLTVPGTAVDIDVEPGQSFNVIFVPPTGTPTIEAFCKYHRAQGMVVTLRVR